MNAVKIVLLWLATAGLFVLVSPPISSAYSTVGTEFVCSFPPVLSQNEPWQLRVAAQRPTEVWIEENGFPAYNIVVLPGTPQTIEGRRLPFMSALRSETALLQSVRLRTSFPVSVAAVHTGASPFTVVPVENWGSEYIVVTPTASLGRDESEGILISAAEDNTIVTIALESRELFRLNEQPVTDRGRRVGTSWQVTLMKGETYFLRTNGEESSSLLGTYLSANKPFGCLYFKQNDTMPLRTMPLESSAGAARRFVKHVRVGEQLRLIAIADQATVRVRTFIPGQSSQPDLQVFSLRQFQTERLKSSDSSTIVIEADAPLFCIAEKIMDNGAISLLPSLEQFSRGALLPLTPDMEGGEISLVVEGDPSNRFRHERLMREIRVNGMPLIERLGRLPGERINGTTLYTTSFGLAGEEEIAIRTLSNSMAFVRSFEGATAAFLPLPSVFTTTIDTLPPAISFADSCGLTLVDIADTVFIVAAENLPPQLDEGIAKVRLLDADNLQIRFLSEAPHSTLHPTVRVLALPFDRRAAGSAILEATDAAGNSSRLPLSYSPARLIATPAQLLFTTIALNTSTSQTVIIRNPTPNILPVEILDIVGDGFDILNSEDWRDSRLTPGQERPIVVQFSPTAEALTSQNNYNSTVYIVNDCDTIPLFEVGGRGGIPRVEVEEWFGGDVVVGDTSCSGRTMSVRNTGSDTLVISQITGVRLPFLLSRPVNPPLPIRIAPGETVEIGEICFIPTQIGSFRDTIRLVTNAADTIALTEWSGRGVQPRLSFSPVLWGKGRLLVARDTLLTVKNNASYPITINGAEIIGNRGNFQPVELLLEGGGTKSLPPLDYHSLQPDEVVYLRVQFTPQATGRILDTLRLWGNDGSIGYAEMTGQGTLPRPQALPLDFGERLFDRQITVDSAIRINNASLNEALRIFEIKFADDDASSSSPLVTDDGSFALVVPSLPATVPVARSFGEFDLPVQVQFTPRQGNSSAQIWVITNAATGPDTLTRRDTLVIPVVGRGQVQKKKLNILSDDEIFTSLTCRDTIREFFLKNTNIVPVNIDGLRLVDDEGVFSLEGGEWSGDSLAAASTRPFRVRFSPRSDIIYSALLIADADSLSDTVKLTGVGTKVPMWFVAPSTRRRHLPGETISLPLRIDAASDILPDEISMELSYPGEVLRLDLSSLAAASGVAVEVLGEVPGSLRLRLSGSITPGIVATIEAQIFVTSENFIPLTLRPLSAPDCVVPFKEQGSLPMAAFCLQGERQIKIGQHKFRLRPPARQPIHDETTSFMLSTAFATDAIVELYSSTGEKVRSFVRGTLPEGEHTYTIETQHLPSGVYFIRCSAGPFHAIEKIIIIK